MKNNDVAEWVQDRMNEKDEDEEKVELKSVCNRLADLCLEKVSRNVNFHEKLLSI
jgi:hypothetical protein